MHKIMLITFLSNSQPNGGKGSSSKKKNGGKGSDLYKFEDAMKTLDVYFEQFGIQPAPFNSRNSLG